MSERNRIKKSFPIIIAAFISSYGYSIYVSVKKLDLYDDEFCHQTFIGSLSLNYDLLFTSVYFKIVFILVFIFFCSDLFLLHIF